MTSETKYFGSPLDSDSFKFKGFDVTSTNIRGLDIFDPSRSITPATSSVLRGLESFYNLVCMDR